MSQQKKPERSDAPYELGHGVSPEEVGFSNEPPVTAEEQQIVDNAAAMVGGMRRLRHIVNSQLFD